MAFTKKNIYFHGIFSFHLPLSIPQAKLPDVETLINVNQITTGLPLVSRGRQRNQVAGV